MRLFQKISNAHTKHFEKNASIMRFDDAYIMRIKTISAHAFRSDAKLKPFQMRFMFTGKNFPYHWYGKSLIRIHVFYKKPSFLSPSAQITRKIKKLG